MNLKRKIIIFVFVACILTFVICITALYKNPVYDVTANKITVVLDAGHGGIDNGVSGIKTHVKESDLNLKIVKKLEKHFNSSGFNVVLTRNTQAGLYGVAQTGMKKRDMQKRKEIISNANPDIVISIHMNKYSSSLRRGAQVFYKKGNDNSYSLAQNIQHQLNNMTETVKKSDCLIGDYYILNCTDYPSVICECGFLSNPFDEQLLITDEYQDKIAYTIYKGAISYLSECKDSFLFN